jgi:hypothetical protein
MNGAGGQLKKNHARHGASMLFGLFFIFSSLSPPFSCTMTAQRPNQQSYYGKITP